MSRADIAAEQAAYTEKYFSCAESIIQEWIAEYVKKPVKELFSDFSGESDMIGFMANNKHYSTYLVTMPPDTNSLVDKQVMKAQEKARKSCSMLYDAVRTVFMAVTGSLAESKTLPDDQMDNIKSLMPMFVEDKMAFHLVRINSKAMQLQAANMQRMQIQKFLQSAAEKGVTQEQKDAIQKSMDELAKIFGANTKEALDAEEALCKSTNEEIKKYNWLHIVLEESDPDNIEMLNESMKRLPMFGLQFQDPDEENYVDKLKKEHGCNT